MKLSFPVKKSLSKAYVVAALAVLPGVSMAQIEGVYHSDGGDDCVLTISEINIPEPQFGDGYYRIESRGVAACMWDGVGLGQSTNLVGGYVTVAPVFNRVYITGKWLFGPSSPKLEIMQTNEEGEALVTSTYTRQ